MWEKPTEAIAMEYVIETPKPPPNLDISFGGKGCILISQTVRRTYTNRFRYWMLCKFFPFKIERWDA